MFIYFQALMDSANLKRILDLYMTPFVLHFFYSKDVYFQVTISSMLSMKLKLNKFYLLGKFQTYLIGYLPLKMRKCFYLYIYVYKEWPFCIKILII